MTKDVANSGLSDPSRQQPVSNGIKPSANLDKNPLAEHSPTASNLSVARAQRERFNREHPQIDVDTSRPVVNPHPFRYLINCPDLCRADDRDRRPIFLLNYVHTAVGHFGRRKRIRRTWAREANYPDVRMKTVFFVGRDPTRPKWFEDALVYEAKKYGDIVQEDFIDTYRNLSYKGVAALKWIATYCNETTYVLKTDDDVFINMFTLLKHLHDIHAEHHRTRLIMCLVWWIAHVQREGQWAIPVDEHPDPLYPIYCAGMGWIVSVDVALAQYRVAPFVPFFWVDDAYISGFLLRALGGAVNHTEMTAAYCGAHEMAVYGHETEWYKYIFTHVHDEELYRTTWDTLVRIAATRRIPSPNFIRPGVLADSYIPKRVLFPPKTLERS